ncbi:3-dehydroquinate synthase [Chryseobacterium sp. cx-311]|uniref:3-dehydroquinate synthase n=1 Tax=Marnyiella aurantia TaxID=2758037 RepID=UPI001AE90704|nr:3-dehydroquinate synthase [Marnyiella aurantia]MBP0612774.1 3-dehydroquinate synthase [Marnyiella aurantia]
MLTFADTDFSQLNSTLEKLKPSKIFILVDDNTHEYCLPALLGNLETTVPYEIMEIEAGEEMKTLNTAAQLWEILAEFEADRNAVLINLGGGVITDLGGFIASTYKRGIRFINIPTTLLGMCDASIGGKTGIDHGFIKNIIGTFAEPELTLIFPDFLRTLPFEQLRSGFAEMLKHGLIADKQHWEDLITLPELKAELLYPYIRRSCEIKLEVVKADFHEKNIRKTLNFGHTIGHAVESLFLERGNPILHGEAVALGMICETRLSLLQGLISEEDGEAIIRNICKYFPQISLENISPEELLTLMKSDKKNSHGQINFSLVTAPGTCSYNVSVNEDNIYNALHYYQNLS